MKWIVTNDLINWATRRDCQENLPLLVRKLVKATATKIGRISFPSGDNIQLSGWDGVLEAESGNENIPEGTSLWEMSTRQDIKSKANEDYIKRTANPQNFDPKESIFVFVTPRVWQGKEDWCNEKKKEGKWKNIRVIDAENLEEWLDEAPSVATWLGQIIGKFPTEGVQPTEIFWDEWSSGPMIKLNSKLVIAGRQSQVDLIKQNILENKKIFSIQSASRDESIAFLISAVKEIGGGLHEDFFSRSIIIDNISTFRLIVNNLYPLILIPRFEDEGVFNFAASKGHQIIIPLGADAGTGRSETIELPRLGREKFVEALRESGISEEEAKQLSKESGRNLTILRRQLEFQQSVPIWAKPENFQDIIPALLVGRWEESKKGDREIIEESSGKSYDDCTIILSRWINTQDSPIYNIGGKWRLASPLDSWGYLSPYLTTKIFEQLKSAFTKVLSEKDPKLELEPDKRYMASIYGKNKKYSNWIREGLCQSLIMIAVYGQKLKMKTPTDPQIWIDFVVKELLKNSSKEMWISLTDELPLIAEASPQSFMEAVEESLKHEVPEIMGMFEEQKALLTPVSYHSGLLWALEEISLVSNLFSKGGIYTM